MRSLLTAAVCLCIATLTTAAPAKSFETVQTQSGAITGHRAPNAKDVWEYLGIPYAQPPLEDLRFAAPKKYTKKGPYNAAKFVSSNLRRASIAVLRVRSINLLHRACT